MTLDFACHGRVYYQEHDELLIGPIQSNNYCIIFYSKTQANELIGSVEEKAGVDVSKLSARERNRLKRLQKKSQQQQKKANTAM